MIGAGNIAWHLTHEFTKNGIRIDKIINRNIEPARKLALETGAAFTNDFSVSNSDSDIIILAINDSAIKHVLERINVSNSIILHTSGSTDLEIFKGKANRYGVLYPLQSFTKYVPVDFSKVPICIEASDKHTLGVIMYLAGTISKRIHILNSEKRQIVHLAGVIANNFTNHLIVKTFDYLEKNKIDKQLLMPLIEETINKIEKDNPCEAQTGPARRKDINIIENHLKILHNEPELKDLYKVISDSIIAYYYK
jgi:predicted short-subunit dehydrogenase-like oxidoreductase (DUF2520 family)